MALLKYAGLYCRLNVPTGADALDLFLRSYFSPYFQWIEEGASGSEPLVTISAHVGPPPTTAPEFSGAPPIPVDKSQGFLHLEGEVAEQDGERWVRLIPYGVIVRINALEKLIDLWTPSPASLRIPVLRVIEDVTLNEMQRRGAVVFHASAVVAGGLAVLAIGHKRAGKTTFLTRLLHGFEVNKLANDNVCVMVEDGRAVAYGWPAFFKVELGTVSSNMELAHHFPAEKRALLDDDERLWEDKEKVPLYPGQGAECFSTTVMPAAPVGVLLFPRFRADAPPAISPVSLPEVASLNQFLQGVNNPNHPDWMNYNPVESSTVKANLSRLVSVLAHTSSTYQITWAPSVDDLLGRVSLLRARKKSLLACAQPRRPEDWPPLPDHNRPDWPGEADDPPAGRAGGGETGTDECTVREYVDREINNLAIAVNAAFKGLLAYQGASGQIAQRTQPIQVELEPKSGYESLVSAIGECLRNHDIEDGDVVVVPDKPFAVAQGRLIPLDWLLAADPKKRDVRGRAMLLEQVRSRVSTPVLDSDLILADTYLDSEFGPMATVGAYDHNKIAADIAAGVRLSTDKVVDVVISDTDTGLDVSERLIGCITICATPLGATRGLTLYEAMRAACAAEFTRGSTRRIPIVICKPIPRSRLRPHIGEFRGYGGRLQLEREGRVAFT